MSESTGSQETNRPIERLMEPIEKRGAPFRLTRLAARAFRNLAELSFEPGPRFNVIYGDNGQGKSSLLEAIDYIATLRSFRGASTDELIARASAEASNARECELRAELEATPLPHVCRVRLSTRSPRSVELDGKRQRSRSAYLGTVPLVLFHPGDMQLVSGSPEQRRSFVDRLLEQIDPVFASTAEAYDRALRSRNRMLRAEPADVRAVRSYDELLASAGAILGQTRARLLAEIGPRVATACADIGGEPGRLSMRYEPRCEPTVSVLREKLETSLQKDLARGFTAEGPHADEIGFYLDGEPAKRYASQGQQRSIVLALKVAELAELERRSGRSPILLLDDVSSELDRGRNRRLFEVLSRLGGQVFLTTTQPELILLDADRTDFKVERGVVAQLGSAR
jgi:DNA replication and repair protein RecF